MECTVLLVMEEICILGIQRWRMKGYRQTLSNPYTLSRLPAEKKAEERASDDDVLVNWTKYLGTFHTRQEMLAQ
jgi:hypothetical protein